MKSVSASILWRRIVLLQIIAGSLALSIVPVYAEYWDKLSVIESLIMNP
jgi:hypothetical protein